MKLRRLILLFCIGLLSCCGKPPTEYQGYVEGENLYLASPYSGLLNKLLVRRGQHVKKGDLLGQIDPNPQLLAIAEAEAALMQAKKVLQDLIDPKRPEEIAAIEAQLKQAEAQLHLAELRVKRYQTLVDKHAIDKDTLDAAIERYKESSQLKAQYEANLKLAKEGARVEQINAQRYQVQVFEAKLKTAKWDLAQKNIYAPIDGVIFDTYFYEGEFVTTQKPIVSLLAKEYIRIDFFIPIATLDTIKLGQKIKFTNNVTNEEHDATISYISSEAEYIPPLIYSRANNKKLVFRVKAIADNPDLIKPGMPVVVRIANIHHA